MFNDPQVVREDVIEGLEQRLCVRLPHSYRKLLTTVSNGGAVEPTGPTAEPAAGIVAVFGVGRGDDLDIELRIAQDATRRLPDGLLPIADAEGGNLICLSLRFSDHGSVWFWDHELELAGEAASLIAENFDRFLDDLVPTIDDELPTADEVWVDPSLLAELEDGQG